VQDTKNAALLRLAGGPLPEVSTPERRCIGRPE